MISTEIKVKKQTVVEDPKLSLKQFARYPDSTAKAKQTILMKCKYPGGYIPRFYEEARKIIVDTFAANYIDDHDIYFSEFERRAAKLKKEALPFDPKTDDYKNRHCSGEGLEKFVAMKTLLMPILERYVLRSNLGHNRDNIYVKEVRIGAMSDILLFDAADNQIGLLKFNFTKTKLKENEAQVSLHVLRTFFKNVKQLNLDPKRCLFVDVFSGKIYNAARIGNGISELVEKNCEEIKGLWPSVTKPVL
ncbi:hypothetical protein [Pedobacter paludis]|uniref:Uncharacterized protein n=1 Tax=Pedobacter paludis TaxID=2203212 RepID=A0A317F619_9SPHI|nr:hypothetical protein [Pedobacter paludis]PWS33349.1 hypothetical protein DF947_01610 [Pedobacter paludis]